VPSTAGLEGWSVTPNAQASALGQLGCFDIGLIRYINREFRPTRTFVAAIGGVQRLLVPDNAKVAVIKACLYEPITVALRSIVAVARAAVVSPHFASGQLDEPAAVDGP
jgi:hypothetical protein